MTLLAIIALCLVLYGAFFERRGWMLAGVALAIIGLVLV